MAERNYPKVINALKVLDSSSSRDSLEPEKEPITRRPRRIVVQLFHALVVNNMGREIRVDGRNNVLHFCGISQHGNSSSVTATRSRGSRPSPSP